MTSVAREFHTLADIVRAKWKPSACWNFKQQRLVHGTAMHTAACEQRACTTLPTWLHVYCASGFEVTERTWQQNCTSSAQLHGKP